MWVGGYDERVTKVCRCEWVSVRMHEAVYQSACKCACADCACICDSVGICAFARIRVRIRAFVCACLYACAFPQQIVVLIL